MTSIGTSKGCGACHRSKPLTQYRSKPRQNSPGGVWVDAICKACRKAGATRTTEPEPKKPKPKKPEPIPTTKVCSTCKTRKKRAEFVPQRDGRYGLSGSCRDCRATKRKAKYVPVRNLPTVIEHTCEWCSGSFTSSHKRSRFCSQRCRMKRHYHSDPERVKARVREWERRDPIAHQVRTAEKCNRRRRRIVGSFTSSDWTRLVRRHDGLCAYCGTKPGQPLTIDHVVPIARGGSNYIGNILPACGPCNFSKNGNTLTEWRLRTSRVTQKKES